MYNDIIYNISMCISVYSSVSSTAATVPAPTPPIPTPSQYIISPIPTVDEIPPPPKPYQHVPPPVPILEEIPPMPKMIPILKPKEPKKVVGIVRKETPGHAWQLANPIATLEHLMGGKRTTKRTNRAAPRKSKPRRTTIKR